MAPHAGTQARTHAHTALTGFQREVLHQPQRIQRQQPQRLGQQDGRRLLGVRRAYGPKRLQGIDRLALHQLARLLQLAAQRALGGQLAVQRGDRIHVRRGEELCAAARRKASRGVVGCVASGLGRSGESDGVVCVC
jgi:hypothetical protein